MAKAIDVAQIGSLSKIGQGGQGIVYRAPTVRSTYARSMVYKEYKSVALVSLDVDALSAMPGFLEALPYADGARLISLAAWPCAIVEKGGKTTGFLMPSIPEEFFTEIWTNRPTPSRVMAEFQHLLNDPNILAMRFRGSVITEPQRLELLLELALALAFLHERNVCVGDISPKNVLYSLSPVPGTYFIDCDAMRVNGISPSSQVETPGWAVPHGEQKATVYSDRYKLGLMALRLLVGDQETKDTARLPRYIPDELRHVIKYSLDPDPRGRPELLDWEAALAKAISVAPRRPAKPISTAPPRPAYPKPPPTVVTAPPSSPPLSSTSGAAPKAASWLLIPGALIGLVVVGISISNTGGRDSTQPTAATTASVESGEARTITAAPETETVTETVISPSPQTRQAGPTGTPPKSREPVNPVPAGDLGLSVPMRNPPCDGRGIVILTSITTPGQYAKGVIGALARFPGASYLRTDLTCPSLRARSDEGNPIYAVYRFGGWTLEQLCAAVRAAGSGAYGKVLDYTTDPSLILCAA